METMDPAVFMQLVVSAVQSGKWALVAVLGLVGVVWVAKKLLAPRFPFFATKPGEMLLALVGSLMGAVITAAASLSLPTGAALLAALGIWFTTVGGLPAFTEAFLPMLMKVPFVAALFPPKMAVVEGVKLAPVKASTSDQVANGP
jgi:hypothetical protein